MKTTTFAALLACLLPAANTWSQENLGRLFFSPERRAVLDQQRQQNLTQNRDALSESNLTLNGVVRRSSGRSTVWLNGNPVDDPAIAREPDPAAVGTRPGSPPLRVGDTLHQGSGEREDLLKGGSVSIRRPADRPQP